MLILLMVVLGSFTLLVLAAKVIVGDPQLDLCGRRCFASSFCRSQ